MNWPARSWESSLLANRLLILEGLRNYASKRKLVTWNHRYLLSDLTYLRYLGT